MLDKNAPPTLNALSFFRALQGKWPLPRNLCNRISSCESPNLVKYASFKLTEELNIVFLKSCVHSQSSGNFFSIVFANHCCGNSGTSINDKKPRAKQSKLVNWLSETRNFFFPLSLSNGSKKSVARASSLICAFFSGLAASRLDTVFFGLRRLSGIMDWLGEGSPSSVSISREERPRCSVRAFAVARREGGVR